MPAKKKLTPYKTSSSSQSAEASEKTSSKSSGLKVRRSVIITLVVGLVILALIYLARGVFVVASVNGEPITRMAVLKELESQGGKQISESLITETLVRQKAKEQGLQASQEELDREIKNLEDLYKKQGQELGQVLSMRGMTRDDLAKQIELKIFLDKLVGEVEVSDAEVAQFIEENNEAYGGNLATEDVKAQLIEQKMSEKSSAYITELQKNANIQYFVNY